MLLHLHPGHASVTWFRVYRPQLYARLRLAFASATGQRPLTLLVTVSRRIIMQKARGHPVLRHGAPTACRHVVSGSVSSPCGVLPIFRSRYYSLSVTEEYLALRDGPRGFGLTFTY